MRIPTSWTLTGLMALGLSLSPAVGSAAEADPGVRSPSGRELYLEACAACHGRDGSGRAQERVGFEVPLPDFRDCGFATREPDEDWLAVTHEGGPARGFDHRMPAFTEALSDAELERIVAHVRTFCGDDAWPRGELNLPRAMFTEKAYPEDELVLTAGTDLEGPGSVSGEITFEKRFGARNQLEVRVPLSVVERTQDGAGTGAWRGGLGDVGLGVKRDVWHDLGSGSIFAAAAEIILPTGDTSRGFGKGTPVFEPFLAFGQLLGPMGFAQLQVGAEFPFDTDRAEQEGFARVALGRTFTAGRWGRAFTPMVEVLGARGFEADSELSVDLVPQLLVTLSARQHVRTNLAVRVPVAGEDRSTGLFLFLLWDWFDGGLFEGW